MTYLRFHYGCSLIFLSKTLDAHLKWKRKARKCSKPSLFPLRRFSTFKYLFSNVMSRDFREAFSLVDMKVVDYGC